MSTKFGPTEANFGLMQTYSANTKRKHKKVKMNQTSSNLNVKAQIIMVHFEMLEYSRSLFQKLYNNKIFKIH